MRMTTYIKRPCILEKFSRWLVWNQREVGRWRECVICLKTCQSSKSSVHYEVIEELGFKDCHFLATTYLTPIFADYRLRLNWRGCRKTWERRQKQSKQNNLLLRLLLVVVKMLAIKTNDLWAHYKKLSVVLLSRNLYIYLMTPASSYPRRLTSLLRLMRNSRGQPWLPP